jgi:ABC-type branched-subunit amino acid transport system substrate-binding protein
MKKNKFKLAPAAIVGLTLSISSLYAVKIGVFHSLSGTMAISETSVRDGVMMAVEEINKSGGVLGEQVEAVVVDPASDWTEKRQVMLRFVESVMYWGRLWLVPSSSFLAWLF